MLDGWHAARELGARGVWMGGTRSWGPAEFGCWMGGTRLWSWGPAEFGCWMGGMLRSWVPWHAARSWWPADGWHAALEGARGVWMGGTGPAVLDGWHAALELGARTVWMGGTRLRSWGPAWDLKEHLHGWGLGGLLCISLPFSWGLRELGAVEGGARSGSLDALCGF